MGIFRRKEAAVSGAGGIAAFWEWWTASGAGECARAIAARQPEVVVETMSDRLGAVAPGLAWELAPGTTSAHRLVVTAAGNPELRAAARRWLRAAPPADATWEYADSRGPVGDLTGMTLTVGDVQVALDDVTVRTTREGNHYNVAVHHPAFAGLPEEARQAATFIALDTALGELAVETWIGRIEPALQAPAGSVSLAGLRQKVDALGEEHLSEGGPAWVLLQAEGPAGPLLAAAQVPLAAAYAPHLDHHVSVRVEFAERTDEGFPGDGSLAALRALEDHLTDRLGGSGLLVAHETSAGTRELHYYVDSTTPAQEVLEAAVRGWEQGDVRIAADPDPGWQAVRHLRT